jgi:hypothetical protein
MKTIMLLLAVFTTPLAFAHPGHDHVPGAITAPHGGTVEGTDHFYLELTVTKDGVRIYPFDHEMDPVPLKELKLEGTMTIPRRKKSEKVQFSPKGDYFEAKIDAKGSHRYALELSISHKGKKEKAKFNVEPQ